MTTLVSVLTKKEELTHDEFVERWTQEHSPIAEQLPGLNHYSAVIPENPAESEFDGVAILKFENYEAFESAFETEIGKMASEDVKEFTKKVHRTVGEELLHVQ